MKLTLHRHDEGFCPIYLTERGNQAVNARELHKALGIKTRFNDWINREIISHNFRKNTHFVFYSNLSKTKKGGRPVQDFILRLDSAKHIAMATMTKHGKRTREYFIWCEQVKDAALAYVTLPLNRLIPLFDEVR